LVLRPHCELKFEGTVEQVSAAEEAGIRERYGKKFPIAADPGVRSGCDRRCFCKSALV
jgi:hypothetical protein